MRFHKATHHQVADGETTESHSITFARHHEKFCLPVYTVITARPIRTSAIGAEHTVKAGLEDDEVEELHKAILLSVQSYRSITNIPDVALAFDCQTRDKQEAYSLLGDEIAKDEQIKVLVFLRVDKAKEFVVNGLGTEGIGELIDMEKQS